MMISALLGLLTTFQPAALQAWSVDPIPYGASAAGIVLLDVAVDGQGAVGEVKVLQDIAPFTDLIRGRLSTWRFRPAHEDGRAVATHVLVAGVFAPAMLQFPAPTQPLVPDPEPDASVPFPTTVAFAPYPARAMGDAGLMVEVALGADGALRSAKAVAGTPGFGDVSVSTAKQWIFRAASRKRVNVPARAYLFFSYRQPH